MTTPAVPDIAALIDAAVQKALAAHTPTSAPPVETLPVVPEFTLRDTLKALVLKTVFPSEAVQRAHFDAIDRWFDEHEAKAPEV